MPEFKPKITVAQVKEEIANDAAAKEKKKAPTPDLPAPTVTEKAPTKQRQAKTEKTTKPKKHKPKRNTGAVEFPMRVRINDYGWLGFRKLLLEALGWYKGIALTLGKNFDGSITLRKAA
jgi:hypothetical protein